MILSRRALLAMAPALLMPASLRAAAALPATPRATDGPFYPTVMPRDQDSDLVRIEGAVREAGGDILHLDGVLLDQNARAIAGARVEIWQCDVNGVYLHPGSGRRESLDRNFQGFGHALTDASGRFSFRTIVPVPYTGRTPHIHAKVLRDGREALTTQLYRAGFPQNPSDFLYRRLSPSERERVSMTLKLRAGASRPAFETSVRIVLSG